MSLRQVLSLLSAALADGTTGLATQATVLAEAEGLDSVNINYNFERWLLSGEMKPGGSPNIAIQPQTGVIDIMIPQETIRDASWPVQIMYETFNADAGVMEDNITITLAAVMKVLDRLREYSDANGGTVMQVIAPVTVQFGSFSLSSADNGFTLNVTIQERSTT